LSKENNRLENGEYLIGIHSRNIVLVTGKKDGLYTGRMVEAGPGQSFSTTEFKIGLSWWNFYNRWPEK